MKKKLQITLTLIVFCGVSLWAQQTLTVTTTACSIGLCNGTATASGGTTYVWPNNTTTGNYIDSLCPGTYTVYSHDSLGFLDSASFTIVSQTQNGVGLTTSTTNTTTINSCDGSATATAIGGTPPYQYFWSGAPATTSLNGSIYNLCAGTYYVTVVDAVNDSSTAYVVINSPSGISISISTSPSNTNGPCSGTAIATITDGIPPFTYLWPDSTTSSSASGLCPGTYTLIIHDSIGAFSTTFTISTSQQFSVSVSSINASNFGACNGSATATPSSTALAPYTFLWSTGQTTSSISNLCAGYYQVTVTDVNGYGVTTTTQIYQPSDSAFVDPSFVLTTTATNVTVNGTNICDGTATVTATGGTPPYTYSWSNGSTSTTISGLCSNVYYITVNDNAGQSTSSVVYISEPSIVITNPVVTTPVDTLSAPPLDTCIVNYSLAIDSAFITSYTVIDSTGLQVTWTLFQNGTTATVVTQVQYVTAGINYIVLTLNCSGFGRELNSTIVKDAINVDYNLIGAGVITTGINSNVLNNKIELLAYPNPIKNKLTVDFMLSEKSNGSITLLNSLGQVAYVLNQAFEKGENKLNLPTENLNAGVYFLQITLNKQTTVCKLIK